MMKEVRRNKKFLISSVLVGAMVLTSISGAGMYKRGVKADTTTVSADFANEITEKRNRFVKQFAMTDGSYTAVTYSMPVHYEQSGEWKEIDTTLKKSGKKNYKTKSTDLSINVSKKLNQKSVISLKRGSSQLSWALKDKKIKEVSAKISNPQKEKETDVLNHNQVTYKKVLKNASITYDIFPEKIQEVVTIAKKQKSGKLTFKINSKTLKVKVKGERVYFKTKKGKTEYTRLKPVITDAEDVSTTNVKLSYNKKKGTLTVTPSKNWWSSNKRKFPMEIRTTYVTEKHRRNVKVGAAYSGAPEGSFSYDKSLLLQANKGMAFTRMTSLEELAQPNVQIRDAALHLTSENTLRLGAGRTFDVGVHRVTEEWSAEKLTYNNRPAYETEALASVAVQEAGEYQCDVTDIVKAWYAGEANYGVALVPDNSNRAYQVKLDRNPYFSVHYEIVDFDGAVELTESAPVTRSVIRVGQENYYYFKGKKGIAYDIYTDSSIDTQATMYDEKKERVGYADDTGLDKNFLFTGAYDGKRYLKVSVKNGGTGNYTLYMKQRFGIPEPTGIKGQDKYTITWNAVENAKEYLVSIYDGGNKINEAVVTGTSYDCVYTSETRGKTLGFTVTARENASLAGEASRMIFNADSQSEWGYTTPMQTKRKNASAIAVDGKIYVLGGENASGALKSFEVYDIESKTWETLAEYPGTASGVCKAAMAAYGNEIYVIGGQTDTGVNASLLKSVYTFNAETKKWTKKADLAEGRTDMAVAVNKNKVYAFAKAGATDKVTVYDMATDTWESQVTTGTSIVIGAASIDNRVFVLQEDGESMYWSEYLPEDNVFDDAGAVCPFATSEKYVTPAVSNGKIYLVTEDTTEKVLVYDVYSDEWSEISSMNLAKKNSALVASGNELYSIGGEMTGFGVLDVMEQYAIKVQTTTKQMAVNKGESYELQLTAGNLNKRQTQIVSLSVNPDEMEFISASSFEEAEVLKEGTEGVKLLKYQPKKGVMVLKLTGSLEQGKSYEACHSVPVEAKIDGKTTVKITLTKKE